MLSLRVTKRGYRDIPVSPVAALKTVSICVVKRDIATGVEPSKHYTRHQVIARDLRIKKMDMN